MTVLVCGCDLFESEPYLEGLDAEDQARVLRTFQQACEQAAHRFGGTVVQCNEQGLLVCSPTNDTPPSPTSTADPVWRPTLSDWRMPPRPARSFAAKPPTG